MRANEFILKEYSREKTANVFGNKLIAALAKDNSYGLRDTELGKSRAFIDQKTKSNDPITDEQRELILNQIMQYLENADPTANKEYVQWLAKVYANQGVKLEDIGSRGRNALVIYHTYKQKNILPAEYRDIGRLDFNTLEGLSINADLRQALAAKQDQEAAKTMPKGDAETVYENDRVRIIIPKDQDAACYYGQGTTWCTASTQSTNFFNSYSKDGPLYILLPKQPQYQGEKYQLHFPSGQFMDEQDRNVGDLVELLTMRFGDLVGFFREREPAFSDWLVFTPDEVLEPLLAKIKTAVEQHVSEIVGDWEATDDYWYNYLDKEGYVYPEGHEDEGQIDWEKVSDADLSYTDWNYDAADFISRIVGAVDLSPAEVRERATDTDEYDYLSVSDLDKIMANAIEQTNSRNEGDGGVSEWLRDHLYIKKRDGQWDVSLIYTQQDGERKEYPINIG